MIVRIVQMTFRENEIDNFLSLFETRKHLIRHFSGCRHLELWQDANRPNIFFTYSIWETEESLNRYRFSDLFKDIWTKTKALFEEKANAWSVNPKMTVS
jgi:heme-degrading monooxygenase HmoA